MRIYYDGPDALVTEQFLVWRTRPVRAYAIAELRNIRLVQRHVGSPRAILTMAAAAAAVLIVAPGWLVLHTTSGRLVLFGAAAVAVTLATLRRRNVRQWELRAAYRGHETTLYTTLEIRTFNQVTRALRRAVESSSAARDRQRMAAA